jgi:hypothetical protein
MLRLHLIQLAGIYDGFMASVLIVSDFSCSYFFNLHHCIRVSNQFIYLLIPCSLHSLEYRTPNVLPVQWFVLGLHLCDFARLLLSTGTYLGSM